MIRTILGGLALLAATASHADVVFNWESTSGPTMNGRLVLADEAYSAGSVDYFFYAPWTAPYSGDPDAQVIELSFGPAPDPFSEFFGNLYRTGVNGSEDGAPSGFNLTVSGEMLVGSLFGGSNGHLLSAESSADGVWRVELSHTEGTYCDYACVGHWVLDISTVPDGSIPAPGSLALVGIGLLAARFGRRYARDVVSDRA